MLVIDDKVNAVIPQSSGHGTTGHTGTDNSNSILLGLFLVCGVVDAFRKVADRGGNAPAGHGRFDSFLSICRCVQPDHLGGVITGGSTLVRTRRGGTLRVNSEVRRFRRHGVQILFYFQVSEDK